MSAGQEERERRWRLILGGGEADGVGASLAGQDSAIDQCLSSLYDAPSTGGSGGAGAGSRRGGLGASAPKVARWLGEIRNYFPTSVVRVMQKDALERLGLQQMLLEPEMLQAVEPDVHLVATLLTLKNVIPSKSKAVARAVVQKVVEELIRKLQAPTRQAVLGSLHRTVRNRRPRLNEIDWGRTVRRNLKNYLPEYRTVIPEQLEGYGRKRSSLRDIIVCVDQSGSMANSVVYSGIFSAVLASLPAVQTRMVVFDTAVVDLTDQLQGDPVDVLFGVQLGGGTDINRALGYCQSLVTRPQETILILISDLCEGGNPAEMLKKAGSLVQSGVQVIALLALDDEGAPWYDHDMAANYAQLGIPCFACTPDLFPELMAAAISRKSISEWAASNQIVLTRGRG